MPVRQRLGGRPRLLARAAGDRRGGQRGGAHAPPAATRLKDVLDYETEPIVSSDILLTAVLGHLRQPRPPWCSATNVSKTLTWFDNGWGYAHRVVDLLRRFEQLDGSQKEAAR